MSLEYPLALILPIIFLICFKLCKPKLEAVIFPNTKFFAKKIPFNLTLFLSVLFLSIALSSPVKIKIYKKNQKGFDILTVLDTSGSMQMYHKLDNAKAIIKDFVKKRSNDRIGLVIFGDIAYIASPLTYDKKTFNEILSRIYPGIAGERTAIYDALFLSTTLFKKSKAKNKIIILITDGMDNSSKTPKDLVLKTLKKDKIKVYTIGIGRSINTTDLENIAKSTGGKFFWVQNISELKKVYETINKLEKSSLKTKITIQKIYYFEYPLIIGIIFYIFFLINYRRSIWNF